MRCAPSRASGDCPDGCRFDLRYFALQRPGGRHGPRRPQFSIRLFIRSPPASGLRGVRALVLVGGKPATERFGEFPLALLDVLGRSVLMRTLDRIRAAGIGEISVLCDTDPLPPHPGTARCKFSVVSPEELLGRGIATIPPPEPAIRVCPGASPGRLGRVGFRGNGEPASALGICHTAGVFARDRGAGCVCDLFRQPVRGGGSVARRTARRAHCRCSARDLRLCKSAASRRQACARSPWTPLPENANSPLRPRAAPRRVDRRQVRGFTVMRASLPLPSSGVSATCAALSVVTRGSSLEHHSEVDCATVIDNSSVMPYTRVGAGWTWSTPSWDSGRYIAYSAR